MGQLDATWTRVRAAVPTRAIAEAVTAYLPEPRVMPWAIDREQAERLWRQSETWTSVTFDAR